MFICYLFITSSVQTLQPLILIYRRGNFVYQYWVITLIYRPLSYPYRYLRHAAPLWRAQHRRRPVRLSDTHTHTFEVRVWPWTPGLQLCYVLLIPFSPHSPSTLLIYSLPQIAAELAGKGCGWKKEIDGGEMALNKLGAANVLSENFGEFRWEKRGWRWLFYVK